MAIDPEVQYALDSLEGRVSNLTKMITDELQPAIDAINASLSAIDTKLDDLDGRITTVDNTVNALGDHVNSLDLSAIGDMQADIAMIIAGVNAFYRRVFQEPLFPNMGSRSAASEPESADAV